MSTWYPSFLQGCFTRPFNGNLSGALRVQLLSSSYAYSTNDRWLSDIPSAKRMSAPQAPTSASFTTGTFIMTNLTFPTLSSSAVGGFAVYLSGAFEVSSSLVMFVDKASVFPLSASGVDQSLVWTPQPLCDVTSAKRWYPNFAQALLEWPVNSDVSAGTVKAALINTSVYTALSTDTFMTDVTANAIVGAPQVVGSKTFTSGTFLGANVTFPGLTGSTASAILVYLDSGAAATSRVMLYLGVAQGLPLTPNGQPQPLNWNASGIAVLGATA